MLDLCFHVFFLSILCFHVILNPSKAVPERPSCPVGEGELKRHSGGNSFGKLIFNLGPGISISYGWAFLKPQARWFVFTVKFTIIVIWDIEISIYACFGSWIILGNSHAFSCTPCKGAAIAHVFLYVRVLLRLGVFGGWFRSIPTAKRERESYAYLSCNMNNLKHICRHFFFLLFHWRLFWFASYQSCRACPAELIGDLVPGIIFK